MVSSLLFSVFLNSLFVWRCVHTLHWHTQCHGRLRRKAWWCKQPGRMLFMGVGTLRVPEPDACIRTSLPYHLYTCLNHPVLSSQSEWRCKREFDSLISPGWCLKYAICVPCFTLSLVWKCNVFLFCFVVCPCHWSLRRVRVSSSHLIKQMCSKQNRISLKKQSYKEMSEELERSLLITPPAFECFSCVDVFVL